MYGVASKEKTCQTDARTNQPFDQQKQENQEKGCENKKCETT